jgi:gamma-glutamyltranspeptidase/glutathione hydrolase
VQQFEETTYLKKGFDLLAHRPVVKSVKGMVTSAHYASSMAGARMFLAGGNAADAVVATAAALNVVEPYMSGLGGIGLLVMSSNFGQNRKVLNFSGLVPQKAVPEAFSPETHSIGTRCPLVPGNPAGWLDILEKFGSLPRSTVFAPAIELAEQGYIVSDLDERFFEANAERLERFPTSQKAFMPYGRPMKAGEILRQPNLAWSYKVLAEQGVEGYYKGDIALEIARFMKEQDGLIDLSDLRSYKPDWEDPISINYRGYDIITPGPNCNAFQVLETLNILEGFDLKNLGHNTSNYIHLMSESIKLAATDRIMFGGDPNFISVPVEGMISKSYARDQRARINHYHASAVMGERYTDNPPEGSIEAGVPATYLSGETTHFSAADSSGNVFSITHTLGAAFGSAVVAGKTGFLLNNNIDLMDIATGSGSNLLVAPGKRPGSNMAPIQIFKDGKFILSIGTPGSYGIPQTTTQMILNYIEFGMTVQEALEAPRFRVMGGKRLNMEDRIPEQSRQGLLSRGHELGSYGQWSTEVGGGHAIACDPTTGVLMGGADPRRDGYAVGI